MSGISVEAAKRLVEGIALDHGCLSPDVIRGFTPEQRAAVQAALDKKDGMIGSSVITLAKNLYTSNARFVFELLQNADDNHYTKAVARGDEPWVHFKVYQARIILECNEDGFTPENLTAICNVGQSSKTGAQGYIGEKGIGFKSVFMAAYKAHIESGNFSFSFQHRPGESGMGMISPIWEGKTTGKPDIGTTRITLFLHDRGSTEEIESQRQIIVKQLQEIQDTHLLFLKNIRRIDVDFYNEEDRLSTSTSYSLASPAALSGRISLRKSQTDNGEQISHYHVSRQTARNLPASENRTYSETEQSSRLYSTAEVVVAFPVTADSVPIVKSQQIFAFLPIRDWGFKFLIHTDFVTQANRQDIVTTSPRNRALVDGIAEAFVEGVQELCQDASLQYTWMRYLPHDGDAPWDDYWRSLVKSIKAKLALVPVLRPRSEGPLRLIRDFRRCQSADLDRDYEPLFDDLNPEIYTSRQYTELDLISLRDYGLNAVSMLETVSLVEADLERPSSRMKWIGTSDDWHLRAAHLLIMPFIYEGHNSSRTRLLGLPLVPLQSGEWVSVSPSGSRPLIYPTVDGKKIPADLGFSLIDSKAALHQRRKVFFNHLGVKQLSVQDVRRLILDKYKNSGGGAVLGSSLPPYEASLGHLTFLYETHDSEDTERQPYRYIHVLCSDKSTTCPQSSDVYISNNDPYGAMRLLEGRAAHASFRVAFLSSIYLDRARLKNYGIDDLEAWSQWLQDSLGIRTKLRLTYNGALTELCRFVMQHRAKSLLGVLRHHWPSIKDEIVKSEAMRKDLGRTLIPCTNGQDVPMFETYLPLQKLTEICSRFLDDDTFLFPVFEEGFALEHSSDWDFLCTAFDVGKDDDLGYYLKILEEIQRRSRHSERARVYHLYEVIQSRIQESGDRDKQQKLVRDAFEKSDLLILLPDSPEELGEWECPQNCRWDAPSQMENVIPLASVFQDVFQRDPSLGVTLTQFFHDTLKVEDCSWQDIVEELQWIKPIRRKGSPNVTDLYDYLQHLQRSLDAANKKAIRDAFQRDALIYAADAWHKVPDCLWASATRIQGKTTLNNHYPNLRSFFVNFLSVKPLTLDVMYEDLKKKGASNSTTAAELKEAWLVFNSLLASADASKLDPATLRKGNLFPVKYADGHVEIVTADTEFAVVDLKHYGQMFEGKAKLLDFSFDDVIRLKTTIQWIGFDDRRLSACVREVTALLDQNGSGESSTTSTHDAVKRKAHGLCRIAAHFGSPKASDEPRSLYDCLRGSSVIETNGISSELHLSQDRQTIKVQKSQGELYIDEKGPTLKIHVPRDRTRREKCFYSNLPRELLRWMMTEHAKLAAVDSQAALRVISNVLNARHSAVDGILENEGIKEVEFPDEEEQEDDSHQTTPPERSQRLLSPSPRPLLAPGTPGEFTTDLSNAGSETPASSIFSESSAQRRADGQNAEYPFNRPLRTLAQSTDNPFASASSPVRPPLTPSEQYRSPGLSNTTTDLDLVYRTLLRKVIAAARRAELPRNGAFNLSTLSAALPQIGERSEDNLRLRTSSDLERDKMVGAAGELFVFELLSNLTPALPGFARENWQSTIRSYITVHPDYADMDAWIGRETADITYADTQGVLTEILIERGYLTRSLWQGRRPRYYIEVKTTTGAGDVPFFMSKYQYRRMQEMSNGGSGFEHPDLVYVIFRVSRLGSESMNLTIYVDPEVRRQEGVLEFMAEGWSVIPGPG